MSGWERAVGQFQLGTEFWRATPIDPDNKDPISQARGLGSNQSPLNRAAQPLTILISIEFWAMSPRRPRRLSGMAGKIVDHRSV